MTFHHLFDVYGSPIYSLIYCCTMYNVCTYIHVVMALWLFVLSGVTLAPVSCWFPLFVDSLSPTVRFVLIEQRQRRVCLIQ